MLDQLRLRIARIMVHAGYVVVPEKPTKDMIKAACASMSPGNRPTKEWVSVAKKHHIRYQAMIKAAPST